MASLTKTLDEMIAEKKKTRTTKGGKGSKGRGGGRIAGGKGGRGAGLGGGRVAGQGRSNLLSQIGRPTSRRSTPYSLNRSGGRGGGITRTVTRTSQPHARNRAFVSGLPHDWEEHHVLRVLETTGAVDKLTIFFDPNGRPTGNALVTYQDASSAKKAVLELDGARLGDKEISVTFARGDAGAKGGKAARPAGKGNKGESRFGGRGAAKLQGSRGQGGGRGKGRTFGKQQKGSGKGRGKGGARVERKEVSKEQLDTQLEAFVNKGE